MAARELDRRWFSGVGYGMTESRILDLRNFYGLLGSLAERVGGARKLAACSGRIGWPRRGVYFFMEDGEVRSDSGSGPRIVRIGTHALTTGSGTKLWSRLSQHRGQQKAGGGNHRGSIFRLIVGTAVMARNGHDVPSWGQGNNATAEVRGAEKTLECEVSQVICAMPFLWLTIEDEPGAQSLRGYIERNAIALLSNFEKEPLDPPSADWLGHSCNRELVRKSGLWNQNHVDEAYDPTFLDCFETLVSEMRRAA
jgi:hypothetical protein